MIEKVNQYVFPNQAIPSIYGESLSYTQQVAYLLYKINECIDGVNAIQSGGLPPFTEQMEGWGPQIIDGAVAWTPNIRDVVADMVTVKATIRAQGAKIDEILVGITELAEIQAQILTGEVE